MCQIWSIQIIGEGYLRVLVLVLMRLKALYVWLDENKNKWTNNFCCHWKTTLENYYEKNQKKKENVQYRPTLYGIQPTPLETRMHSLLSGLSSIHYDYTTQLMMLDIFCLHLRIHSYIKRLYFLQTDRMILSLWFR